MFTLATDPLKKCLSEPRALFSVSRSSSVNGISLVSNHSARATIRPVLPTPPLPPMVKTTRLFFRWVFIATLLGRQVSTGDRPQSRAAARPSTVESGWAKSSPGFAPSSVHQSKAKPTAELVQPIAETGPGTGPAGGRTSPATTTGAPLADTSGHRPGDGVGDRGISGRPEPLCGWQSRGQLHRHDPLRTLQRQAPATGEVDQARQHAAALSMDRSDDACGTQGC